MKFKIPSFEKPLAKLKSFRWQAKPKAISRERMPVRRQAAMRRAAQDFDEMDEPTTKLSSAFIVVLILHIVAVAGIYAFNSIKAHRKSREMPIASSDRPVSRTASSSADASQSITATNSARASTSAPTVPTQKVYKAHGGETISRVAALQGVSASELAQLNGLREAAILKPDQTIVIPPTKAAKAAAAANASADAKKSDYLASKNEDAAFLRPNTTAKPSAAPAKPAATTKPASAAKTYVVAKGDTVTSIARKNGVTVEELMKANDIKDAKKLQPSQSLKIPAKKAE